MRASADSHRERFMVFARATRATASDPRLCTIYRVPNPVPTACHRVPGATVARGRHRIDRPSRARIGQCFRRQEHRDTRWYGWNKHFQELSLTRARRIATRNRTLDASPRASATPRPRQR
jgi:hypothetical protein